MSLTRAQRSARFHVMLMISPLVGMRVLEAVFVMKRLGAFMHHQHPGGVRARSLSGGSVTADVFGRFDRKSLPRGPGTVYFRRSGRKGRFAKKYGFMTDIDMSHFSSLHEIESDFSFCIRVVLLVGFVHPPTHTREFD